MGRKVPSTIELDPLSYQIIGICFEIHNELGNSYKEVYYQRAFEKELRRLGIKYEKEKEFELEFKGDKIGKHFVDFLIKDTIVVEFKTVPFIKAREVNQVLSYLKSMQKRLGLIINFRPNKVQIKRVVLPNKFIKK